MEDMHGGRMGPQLYVLSEQGYEKLERLKNTLQLMASVTFNEDDNTNGNALLTISRADMSWYFEEIAAQICEALSRVSNENTVAAKGRVWQ